MAVVDLLAMGLLLHVLPLILPIHYTTLIIIHINMNDDGKVNERAEFAGTG